MKILQIRLKVGDYAEDPTYFYNLLKKCDLDTITDPSVEFYFIVATIISFHWSSVKPLDEKFIQDLNQNKAKLILSSDCDSFGIKESSNINIPNFIKDISQKCNIPINNIIYVDSNYKIEKSLLKYNINCFWINLWETNFTLPDNTKYIIDIKNKVLREKKFLYLGGKARDFRLRFVGELLQFAKDSYISTQFGTYLKDDIVYTVKEHIIDINYGIKPYVPEDVCGPVNYQLHYNSYINIIPMSHFYNDYTHLEISEKLFKPIITMQPFIILGERETLKFLKERGYKTFDKWIDESYDLELDDEVRFNKVLHEVKRLNNLKSNELSDMLYDMLPILEHNYNLNKYKKENKIVEQELTNKLLSYTIT